MNSYDGVLKTRPRDGYSRIITRSKYSEISPSITYEIPLRYVGEKRFSFHELDRIINLDGKPIAGEWESVFELEGWQGMVFGTQALCLDYILSY